jgi:hypothetical protein
MEARTPPADMSLTLSWTSQQPRRISSNDVRIDAVLLAGSAGHGIETDVGDLNAFELPDVVSGFGVHNPGAPVCVLRRQPSLEEISRLHRVIINADKNQILDPHNHSSPGMPRWARSPSLYI